MAIEVFPTANDIGGSGTGRTATEENMVQTLDRFSAQSSILSGMVPSAGTGLAVDVAAGRCQIDGYLVRFTATEAVTVTASLTDYYLWLQLTGAGDSPPAVTATAWVETADLTSPPANAALVAKFTTSGSAVTDIGDDERREGAGHRAGIYTGNASATQDIDLGATPALVQARHFSDVSTSFRWSQSNIFPGNQTLESTIINLTAQYYNPGGQDKIEWADDKDDGGLMIIKDGFQARGELNTNSAEYSYIALF